MAGLRCGALVWLLGCWVGGLSHAHITLDSSPASVRLAAPRSPHHPLHLQVDAFNQQHQLTLKPAPSPFAPSFKLHTTTRDHQGRLLLQEVEVADNDLSTIYHDPDIGAVVSVDGSSVEGLLTPTLAIKPSPDGGHQAVRFQLPDISGDIYDYVEVPRHLRSNDQASTAARFVNKVTPELLIIIDSKLASTIGSDDKVKKYLGVFYNSVNHRYRSVTDPKIQFILNGALIIRKSDDEPFITKNNYKGDYIYGVETLISLEKWLYLRLAKLPKHDIAILMTGKDMVKKKTGSKRLAGIANTEGACGVNSDSKISYQSGMAEDPAGFYKGVQTITHELAHTLGSYHDGIDKQAKDCPWDDGYIMSYKVKKGTTNKFYFSECSKKLMKKHIESSYGACLRSIQGSSQVPISSKLPGEIISIDDQCKKATGYSSAKADESVSLEKQCQNLSCKYSYWFIMSGSIEYGYPAADGTPCKKGGVCYKGMCQSPPATRLE